MAVSCKGAHFPKEVILMGVRWYVAYPLSTRHVEELMEERGVEVDHSTINRWVIKYSPPLLPPVTKRAKTTGLKMYQGQLWAHFRRGDSEKVSEPEADVRPFVAGVDWAPHRPPESGESCCVLRP